MHSLWVAYAPALGCIICTPLGCICARSETQTLMLAPALIETNCVQHHPMTQLCSSELDLPFVFLIVSYRCQRLFAALSHWCICAPSPVHMHPLGVHMHSSWGAYAPELGCICTRSGVHMRWLWGAHGVPTINSVISPLGWLKPIKYPWGTISMMFLISFTRLLQSDIDL